MHAGVATRKITPPVGIEMMGFAARDHGAEGIHDDLFVKTLWLSDGTTQMALISADLSGLAEAEVGLIKGRIGVRCGVSPGQILINCTHTHAGPLVARRTYGRGEFDDAYRDHLRNAMVECAAEAQAAQQLATLSLSTGTCDVGVNRRLPTPGGIVMAPNPDGHWNRDALALLVETREGAPLAVLFSVSCHPTTMGADNYQISAEYPGVACRVLEAALDGAVALFMQGAAGEIKPRQTGDPANQRFRSGTFSDVEAVGQEVARTILHMIARPGRTVRGALHAAAGAAMLPFDLPADPGEYYRTLAGDEAKPAAVQQWAVQRLSQWKEGALPAAIDCPVQVLGIGDVLRLAAFGGELCSPHADHIKEALSADVVYSMGYSNGGIGYLPTDAMLREGGYEAVDSVPYMTGLSAPFALGIDQRLVDAVVALAE